MFSEVTYIIHLKQQWAQSNQKVINIIIIYQKVINIISTIKNQSNVLCSLNKKLSHDKTKQ